MSYPVGWDLVNVTGTYIGKNGVPCVGSVTFSSPQLVLRSGTIVPAADIVFTLVNGAFSGQIPATDDPNANPVGWVYTVTENVPGGRQGYQIVAPHTSPGIDLSTVVPVTMPMPPTFGFPYVTLAQLASNATGQGAALLGWPSGFGINEPSTGQFFSQNGAAIQRFNDRVFIGSATVNDGAFPNVNKDWLTIFQNTYSVPPAIVSAQMATLTPNVSGGAGGQAIVGGAQSLYFTAAGSSAIGVSGYGINNNATYLDDAWAFYGEGHRMISGGGGAWGMELDVTNYGDAVYIDPYGTESGTVGGQVIGLQISGGAQHPATGQKNPSAALLVGANPVAFDKGIIFQNGSLSSSYKEAICLASGHSLQWYAGLNTRTSRIECLGTTTNGATLVAFLEGGVFFQNASSPFPTNFAISTSTNGANYLQASPGSTGNPPYFLATGSDANIDLQLSTTGSGTLRFGTYTAGTVTQAGYITIKDIGGTTRRLLVG